MGSILSTYEKFLAGQPLNDDLAAIRDGRIDPQTDHPLREWLNKRPVEDRDRELTNNERILLKEAKLSGVLDVMIRLHEKALSSHIREATMHSEVDPLNKPNEVAATWGYVVMFRRAITQISSMMEEEIRKLE